MYVGVTFLYVTVFLSNICMLVICLFILHNKHIYVIVVPHTCCSKHPTPCTCLVCCTSGPMHHSGTVSNFIVSQWESEVVWQPGQQAWVAVLISQQPTQRNKTCVRMIFTQEHFILIHVKHRVSIYVYLFFLYRVFNSGRKPTARLFAQTGYSNRTWVQAKMTTAAAGDCQ